MSVPASTSRPTLSLHAGPRADADGGLRGCPACRSTRWSASGFLANGRFPLVHCEGCGLGALTIVDSDEGSFDEYWSEVNQRIYADPAVVGELAAKYERYYRRAQPALPNQRFLDVGSGAGVSVGTAAKLGFQAVG